MDEMDSIRTDDALEVSFLVNQALQWTPPRGIDILIFTRKTGRDPDRASVAVEVRRSRTLDERDGVYIDLQGAYADPEDFFDDLDKAARDVLSRVPASCLADPVVKTDGMGEG